MFKVNEYSLLLWIGFLICGLIIWPAYSHKMVQIFGKVTSADNSNYVGHPFVQRDNDYYLTNTDQSYYYASADTIAHMTFISCIGKTLTTFAMNECMGSTPPDAGTKPNEPTCDDFRNQKKEISKAMKEIENKAAKIPPVDVELLVNKILNLKNNIWQKEDAARMADRIWGKGAGDVILDNPAFLKMKKDLKELQGELKSYLAKVTPLQKRYKQLDDELTAMIRKMIDKGCRHVFD